MRKIYWLFIFLFSLIKAQVKVIDLSTGRYDNGTVMPIEIVDPDWTYTRPDGSEHKTITRHTYSGWYVPAFSDNTYNDRWITGEPGDPTEGYFIYKSKTFVVPKGSKAKLEVRALAFVRQWTYLVQKNNDGTETETQISQTTWMNDGAKGWFNSRNPLVDLDLTSGTYCIKVKVYTNNGNVRQSLNVASKVYISPSNEKDYTLAPNSYIFDIDKAKKENLGGIFIPVKKAFAVWENNEYFKKPIPSGKLSASIYWEDVPGLIRSTQINGKGEDANIEVMIDKARGKGNAVIALHVGSNGNYKDPIYWSWHVWVTDDPSNGAKFGHKIPLSNGRFGEFEEKNIEGKPFEVKFMDRNLGALSTNLVGHGWTKTGGLMYQWGRKDPFPPLTLKDGSKYDVIGSVSPDPVKYKDFDTKNRKFVVFRENLSNYTYPEDMKFNIQYSVHNPLTYINRDYNKNGTNYTQWFTNVRKYNEKSKESFNLWGDNTSGKFKNSFTYQLKSPFDPCPHGWRVPSFTAQSGDVSDTSPWGRQRIDLPGITGNHQLSTDVFTKNGNSLYEGIKIYPGFGMDFTHESRRRIGKIPLTGKFNKYYDQEKKDTPKLKTKVLYQSQNNSDTKKEKTSRALFQDQSNQGFLLSATMGENGLIRSLIVTADPVESLDGETNVRTRTNFTSHSEFTEAGAVRCMQDPNLFRIDDFTTEYIDADYIDYFTGLNNPNTYIVKEGEEYKEIPVNKAYAIYNQYLTDHEWPQGKQSVNVYWTTNMQLVNDVSLVGTGENAIIKIKINPGQVGNAVVSLHMGTNGNSLDPVIWSWQIWVPKGDPEQNTYTYVTDKVVSGISSQIVNPTTTGLPPLTTEFMDRNLGAVESYPIELKQFPNDNNLISKAKLSGGMHYQWGRKDPIPTFGVDQLKIYLGSTINGKLKYFQTLTESTYNKNNIQKYSEYSRNANLKSNDSHHQRISKILKYSVNNPIDYLYNDNGESIDWISDKNGVAADRWGHGDEKSPFDPCPDGWRVPDFSFIGHMKGKKTDNRGFSPWYNGHYNNGEGLTQRLDTLKKYDGTTINHGGKWGIIFDGPDYKIGGYLTTGIRGQYRSSLPGIFKVNQSFGLWSSTMFVEDNKKHVFSAWVEYGRNNVNLFQFSATEPVNAFAAMNVRCARDVPRYDGTVGKNSQPKLKKAVFVNNENESKGNLSEFEIQIYPNPNAGLFSIKLQNISEGTIQIMNINGTVIFSKNIKNKEVEVNIQGQPAGIYIVKVQSGQKTFIKKIIKN